MNGQRREVKMINLLLIITACVTAYILCCLYIYIDGKIAQYKLWKQSKDELRKFRIKRELRKMQGYYYSLAINNPLELSKELAIQAVKSKRG